jgi:hypothetical protein
MPHHDPLAAATFHASELAEVDVAAIRAALATHAVARIRGLFDPDGIRTLRDGIAAGFSAANDRKHDARDTEAVRTNFQKIVVGGITGTDRHRSLARFLRMLFNPIFAADVYGMRATFVRLARLRNRLFGLADDFAVHGTEDGYWTAARIHQYPRGGGFMVPHRDRYSRMAVVDAGAAYVQVFLVMSRKGEDFSDGGAFIERDGERLFYEDACALGDVMVYDGGVVHGVGDVDPMAPLDLAGFTGRVAAFASLYRHLTPGEADYVELAKRSKRFDDEAGT